MKKHRTRKLTTFSSQSAVSFRMAKNRKVRAEIENGEKEMKTKDGPLEGLINLTGFWWREQSPTTTESGRGGMEAGPRSRCPRAESAGLLEGSAREGHREDAGAERPPDHDQA